MTQNGMDFLRASPTRQAASRLIETFGLARKSITAPQLIDAAMALAGRRDLGDAQLTASIDSNLEALLAAVEQGATLTFNGRMILRQFLVDALASRLQVVAWDRQHPNVFKTPIRAPVFIIGLPSSGISHLHQLMAQDPANRVPIAWEVASPVPPPSAFSFARDARIDTTDALYASLKRRFSPSTNLPLLDARVAQDCSLMLTQSGASEAFSIALNIPSYRNWMQSCNMVAAYQWHKQLLQHLQSAYMSERWLLKSPQHLCHLPALTAVYPDARFIVVHRNPEHAMVEHLRFCQQLRKILQARSRTGTELQDEIVHWAVAMDNAMQFLKQHAELDVVHLRFSDLQRRPLKTVETVYESLAPTFTDPAYKRIDDYVNRQLSQQPRSWASEHAATTGFQGKDSMLAELTARAFARYTKAFDDLLL